MLNLHIASASGARRGTLVALAGAIGILALGSYSVYALELAKGPSGVPAPSITLKPRNGTGEPWAKFKFTDRWRHVSFQCSLDGARFSYCSSPILYHWPLRSGRHTFRVRAQGFYRKRPARFSRVTSYKWLIDLRPPAPHIQAHPGNPSIEHQARFAFSDSDPNATLQCSIDSRPWRRCSSPISYPGLGFGQHRFRIRALNPPAPHRRPTEFRWSIIDQSTPADFSISVGGSVGAPLYPGATPEMIQVHLSNPNDVPIFVTSLDVAVSGGPAGCPSATNINVVQSNVSSSVPVEVQAHSSVTLPAQGASTPTIQLLNLPVNQDACQHAQFPLSFTGSAHS